VGGSARIRPGLLEQAARLEPALDLALPLVVDEPSESKGQHWDTNLAGRSIDRVSLMSEHYRRNMTEPVMFDR
jgi:hypothetical protein